MKNLISVCITFVMTFLVVFILAGLFLMPLITPLSYEMEDVLELKYWQENWIGLLLGIFFSLATVRFIIIRLLKKKKLKINENIISKKTSSIPSQQKSSPMVSFIFVFWGVFFLAGLLLRPSLPPFPDRPVSFVELEYWYGNWSGILLGIFFGRLSARSVLRKNRNITEYNQAKSDRVA